VATAAEDRLNIRRKLRLPTTIRDNADLPAVQLDGEGNGAIAVGTRCARAMARLLLIF
jgi:hypothetical protein